jgi:hypothetical protein
VAGGSQADRQADQQHPQARLHDQAGSSQAGRLISRGAALPNNTVGGEMAAGLYTWASAAIAAVIG